MHFAFIPYGARQEVERLMRDLESQKFKLSLSKDGKVEKYVWITGQVRELPFGVKEYVFPREYRDVVLHTLCDNTAPNRYSQSQLYGLLQGMIKTGLRLKKMPKYESEHKYIWSTEHVSIMPIGIREDTDMVEPKEGEYKGYTHEAI